MSAMNSTVSATTASALGEARLLSGMWSVILSARSELCLFVVAMLLYFALFMQKTTRRPKLPNKTAKLLEEDYKERAYPDDAYTKSNVTGPAQYAQVENAFQATFESGDYRSALRNWGAMKKFERAPSVSLAHVVEAMQRLKKDTPFILQELKGFFKMFSSENDMSCVNELLESIAKRLDSDLVEAIVEMLPDLGLKLDEQGYELLLNMYFTTRNFQDVKSLVSQMKANKIPFSTRSSMVVIKTALKSNSFDEAVEHFRDLKSTWKSANLSSTPSVAPSNVVSQLVELACKQQKLGEFLSELQDITISEEVLNTMLLECVRQGDFLLTASVEKLARSQDVRFTETTYGLLIKGMGSDRTRVHAVFEEVLDKGIEISADFAGAVLAFCSQTANVGMAEKLYGHMKPKQLPVLSAFIRFYAGIEQYEKACDVYEQDFLPLGTAEENGRSLQFDLRMERSIMDAALKCGRGHLAKNLLNSSPSDVAKHITMIRNFAVGGNLEGALSVFTSLEQNGIDLNSVIYNTVLDACVECGDLSAAEEWMVRMKSNGMMDVVSFNTLIKAHLQKGNFGKVRSLMEEMRSLDLQPNRVTFNELINAIASKGEGRRTQMWEIVEEMRVADVRPNQVTISILLKSLNYHSGEADILKTLALLDTMEGPMDEVLLSSIVEACVRVGKPALLVSQLKKLQDAYPVAIQGSHTYGSLIKAYGHAKDIGGIWRCWKEMRSRHIKPTSITVGCMIEAIVSNGDTEGAFDLIHQMQEEEQCMGVLNSVIYCSVLKGFTRERKIDRVWAVYQEMQERNIELSIVTYNTLIDACARSGRMEHLPKILEDMKTQRANPNVITYSTMLKGHCQNGNIKAGFAILEQMKKEKDSRLKPDEIMYNSLLDGCAQNALVDEGLHLLEEMQNAGVQPSNFTLSILVKLMNRARRLDQAFALVEELTKKYNFWPNVHVYANLVQACTANQQLPRAMGVLEQMVKERIVPDSRTYGILVRTSIFKGSFEQAAGLLRGALGLPDALPFLQQSNAACPNLDHALVNEALGALAARGHSRDLAIPLLSAIRKDAPKVYIDSGTLRKVMSPCLSSNSGKGKGKGKA